MKYTLALIALLGLTENANGVMISKHHGHKHHKHQHENVQIKDEDVKTEEKKTVAKVELTADEKAAAALVVKREDKAAVVAENFQSNWENSENYMKKQVKESDTANQ